MNSNGQEFMAGWNSGSEAAAGHGPKTKEERWRRRRKSVGSQNN
jgi:hypothetical protein